VARWDSQIRSLDEKLDRIRDVYICNEDALKCIERWSSPQTLVYVDPPYPETNQGHYGGYTMEDWEALCELLDRLDCSYILSNYPQPIEPKSAQQRIEIKAMMSSSGQGKVGRNRDKSRAATNAELGDRTRTEVLWICDRSAEIRKDLGFAKYHQPSLLAM
jgi:DNA adenine methylase